jgi:hypothetical protein
MRTHAPRLRTFVAAAFAVLTRLALAAGTSVSTAGNQELTAVLDVSNPSWYATLPVQVAPVLR